MALNNVDAAAESFRKALDLEPNDGNVIHNQFIRGKLFYA